MPFQRNSTKKCYGAETGPCRVCPKVPHTSEVSVGCCKGNKTLLNICPKSTSSFSCSSCCATLCFPHAPSLEDLLQGCHRTPGHEPVLCGSTTQVTAKCQSCTIISSQIHWLVTDCSKNHHYGSRPRQETLFCLQLTPAHLCSQGDLFPIPYLVPTQFSCNMSTVTCSWPVYDQLLLWRKKPHLCPTPIISTRFHNQTHWHWLNHLRNKALLKRVWPLPSGKAWRMLPKTTFVSRL